MGALVGAQEGKAGPLRVMAAREGSFSGRQVCVPADGTVPACGWEKGCYVLQGLEITVLRKTCEVKISSVIEKVYAWEIFHEKSLGI